MEQNIFLCDRKWNIHKILKCSSRYGITQGGNLTELVKNPSSLTANEDLEVQKQNMVMLQFDGEETETPVIVCTFPRYYLVFIVRIENQEDFSQFTSCYMQCMAWADENIQIPYNDEYYQIQMMNNQLINSRRALTQTNARLKKVLDEVREANTTITLLEHDQLTGLYCSSAFYRKAQEMIEKSPEEYFEIIVLDIDHFKLVNEIFGRKSGDRLLQSLGMFLTGLKDAEKGILARAEADTFYMIMPSSLKFHETLSREVAAFLDTYPLPALLQEKIGIFSVRNPELSVEQMCDRARLAIDNIRPQDNDRVAFYDQSLHEKVVLNHKILDSIQSSLDNKEFQLYLQPKVNMETQEVIGAEALVRWIHPEMGFVPPDKFIPVLEREGYVYDVDKYVWEEACCILKARQDRGLRNLPISINIARGDLYEEDLADVLDGLIRKYDLHHGDLRLEIIERAYVDDSANICRVLTHLRELGFMIEMDDFGTGASSLSMVAEMPIDVLKLDRTFLTSGLNNKRQIEVIRFIINLAQTLDIGIIAEGVENQEQADVLLSMGCRYAQGYFYHRPQPARDFLDFS